MLSITPSLWFDHNLEEAVAFYSSVFPISQFQDLNRTRFGAYWTCLSLRLVRTKLVPELLVTAQRDSYLSFERLMGND